MEKTKIKKIAIILGVLLLPLIYSVTYLLGFWDPYNNLGNIKVAVVNEDNCTKNCKSTDLIKELKNSDSFDFIEKDKDEAEEGLLSKKYYATLTIPEDFTKSLENVSSKDRVVPTITYRTNKKTNYIASQLIENAVIRVEGKLDQKIAKEIVKTLSDKLNEVPEQTKKISNGLGQIYTGSIALNNGAIKLKDGTNKLEENSKKITEGINTLNNGISQLQEGTTSLKEGTSKLQTGGQNLQNGIEYILSEVDKSTETLTKAKDQMPTKINKAKKDASDAITKSITEYTRLITKIYLGMQAYQTTANPNEMYTLKCQEIIGKDSTTRLAQALSELTSKSDSYKELTILEAIQNYTKSLGTDIGSTLNTSVSGLSTEISTYLAATEDQMGKLQDGLKQLDDGAKDLNQGIGALSSGINRLDSGVKTIYNGSNTLNESYKQFNSGVSTLNSSVTTLKDGTKNLEEGTKIAKEAVEEGTKDTEEQLKSLDGLDKYTEKPVKFKDNSYGEVKDYGTFFSPFFMSLSLWLGGILIIMGLYYDPEHRFEILSKNSSNRPKRLGYYTLIGIAQSIILPIILVLALNFTVTNWFLFFISCILIGLSFLSIMLFLVFNFDDIGKFLSIVLLVIQLAACAGTFPLETEPTFFGNISPFMPMTYSVELLRESFVSIDSSILTKDIFVLSAILIVFTTLIFITGHLKTKKEKLAK